MQGLPPRPRNGRTGSRFCSPLIEPPSNTPVNRELFISSLFAATHTSKSWRHVGSIEKPQDCSVVDARLL